jgi:hypothetical protein
MLFRESQPQPCDKCSRWSAGAMQEVLTEQYNDQLRELREAGLSESSSDFRDAIRELRDEERAPAGSVQASSSPSRRTSIFWGCNGQQPAGARAAVH